MKKILWGRQYPKAAHSIRLSLKTPFRFYQESGAQLIRKLPWRAERKLSHCQRNSKRLNGFSQKRPCSHQSYVTFMSIGWKLASVPQSPLIFGWHLMWSSEGSYLIQPIFIHSHFWANHYRSHKTEGSRTFPTGARLVGSHVSPSYPRE